MASDDTSLVTEVRSLTDYDNSIYSATELIELIEIAKGEIRSDVGDPTLTFYDTEGSPEERALFWLTCIFAKMKAGEIDAPNISISSLRIRQASEGERYGLWFSRFEVHRSRIQTSEEDTAGRPMGIINATRDDERTYGYDSANDTLLG
jgi:hypothetical protein